VLVEAERSAGPVHRRAADRFHDPSRQIRKVLRHAPVARGGSHVGPGELREALPFVVDEILDLDARTGFEDHDLDAFLRKLVAQGAARA
jgi:hypothetical protein